MNLPIVLLLLMICLSPPDNQEETDFPEDPINEMNPANTPEIISDTEDSEFSKTVELDKQNVDAQPVITEPSVNILQFKGDSDTIKHESNDGSKDINFEAAQDSNYYLYESQAVPIAYDVHIHECEEDCEYKDCVCYKLSQNSLETVKSTTRNTNMSNTENTDNNEYHTNDLHVTGTVQMHTQECEERSLYHSYPRNKVCRNSLEIAESVPRTVKNCTKEGRDHDYYEEHKNYLYEAEAVPLSCGIHIHECEEKCENQNCYLNDLSLKHLESNTSTENRDDEENCSEYLDPNGTIPMAYDVHIQQCDENSKYENCSYNDFSQNHIEPLGNYFCQNCMKRLGSESAIENFGYKTYQSSLPYYNIHSCCQYCAERIRIETNLSENQGHRVNQIMDNKKENCDFATHLSCPLMINANYEETNEPCNCNLCHISYSCRNYPIQIVKIYNIQEINPPNELEDPNLVVVNGIDEFDELDDDFDYDDHEFYWHFYPAVLDDDFDDDDDDDEFYWHFNPAAPDDPAVLNDVDLPVDPAVPDDLNMPDDPAVPHDLAEFHDPEELQNPDALHNLDVLDDFSEIDDFYEHDNFDELNDSSEFHGSYYLDDSEFYDSSEFNDSNSLDDSIDRQAGIETTAELIVIWNYRPLVTLMRFYFWRELFRRCPKICSLYN